nr:phospholipase-like protein [Tanacetum cinerariifolium]
DSSFWRGLCGLDDHRKGWLLDEGSLSKFYANNDLNPVAWSDVERDEISDVNNCAIIYVDSSFWRGLCGLDDHRKGWLLDELNMRECLAAKIPIILKETGVFEKKNIDPAKYNISFRHADHVPKQGGVFGDCGVFMCMFLYRLAHSVPLAVDDHVQVALAYREKMIHFCFQHKMLCPLILGTRQEMKGQDDLIEGQDK